MFSQLKKLGVEKTAGCTASDAESAHRYNDLKVRYIAARSLKFMVVGSRNFIKKAKS